jgi:hypothetical protein
VSAAFRRRWRSASSTVCSAAVLALAACGGGSDDAGGPAPALPAGLGNELAAETADVEQALAAGDPVAAREEAVELVELVDAAIARGDVPDALRGELRAGAERLLALVPPPPAPPPAPEPPPPPPAPEEDDCEALQEQLDLLEEQIDELPNDDPARDVLEGERDILKEQLKECERGDGGEEGEGDGGDD